MWTRWGNRKIVTIAQMFFQLSDVFLATVVIIAKAPYCLAFFLYKARSGKLSFPSQHLSCHFITMSLHKLFMSANYVQGTKKITQIQQVLCMFFLSPFVFIKYNFVWNFRLWMWCYELEEEEKYRWRTEWQRFAFLSLLYPLLQLHFAVVLLLLQSVHSSQRIGFSLRRNEMSKRPTEEQ